MKNSRQLKDLIRNMAKEKGINAQILLRNYMLERLLERISLSKFRDHFVLKGG
jgi:predicted nucleotidyltransferase component of viral defense system